VTDSDKDTFTLADALQGGPGLDGYAFQADVYCVPCGQDHVRIAFFARPTVDWNTFRDSEEVPQPIFFGESETEQCCADCGEHLYGPEAGKDLQGFIDEHRTELSITIWKQVPNIPLDDDALGQWIANDEGLYNWAREEGYEV